MKKLIIPVLLCVLVAGSCKKNENTTSTPVSTSTFKTYGSMDEIFNSLSLQPKVVTFDAAAGSSFYGNSGTRYIFKPNCFVDATGATVTGNVQVAVTEWLKKGDMIFSRMLPVSYGDRLVSGGEFGVKATKNGGELFVKPGMSYQVNIPQSGSTDTVMSLFRGMNYENLAASRVNWSITKPDTTSFIKYYRDTLMVICDSFNFWNCDHFSGATNLQDFKVTLTVPGKTITNANSYMNTYALFSKENSLLSLHSPADGVYSVNYVPNSPIHFVSMGLISGHFYGGVLAATPKTGENYTVTLTEVDPAAFKAQINGLY